jgi:Fe-S oxidoreductase
MSKEGKFLVFCLEMYKADKRMTGKQAIELFKRYGLTDYVLSGYEALHTTGTQYIIEDIDLFIEARQAS